MGSLDERGLVVRSDTTDAGNATDTLKVEATKVSESGWQYRARFKNTAGELLTAPATLTVEPHPEAPNGTKAPASATVTEPATASFTAEASGVPAPKVQWEVSTNSGSSFTPDTTDTGNATDTLKVEATKVSESGWQYRARFKNSAGEALTAVATLTVEPHPEAPNVTKAPASATVVEPATASFTAEASGVPAPKVQWEVSTNGGSSFAADTTDAGNTTDTLKVEATKVSESGWQYRARFKNTAGELLTAPATLTVEPHPEAPTVTRSPASATVVEPASASFTAEASGVPAPSVQWEVSTNGGSSFAADTTDAGNATDTLKVEATKVSESGWQYRARFENSAGNATTAPATLTVEAFTEAPKVTKSPASVTVVEPASASFTAEASGVPAPSVQWEVSTNGGSSFSPDTTDAGATTDTLKVEATKVSESGWEYRARFKSSAVEVTSAAATLTVQPRPEAPKVTKSPVSASVVEPASASFTAEASGVPAPSVQWEVSTNGGSSFASDTADAGNTTDTLKVEATKASESGWEYRARFKSSAGEALTAPATLTVEALPVAPKVTKSPVSASVAEPATATFTAEASGVPAPTVQWEVSTDKGSSFTPDTTDAGSSTGTLKVEATTASQSGWEYRARFKNVAGEVTTTAALLTVKSTAVAPKVTKQPVAVTVTEPATATFTVAASGTPAPTVQWEVSTNKGSTFAADTTDAGNTTDTLKVEATTTALSGREYRAKFENRAGKATSNAVALTVKTSAVAPKVTKQPVAVTVTEPATATFTVAASGTPAPTVQWEVSANKGSTFAADTTDAGNTTDTLKVEATTTALSGHEYRAKFENRAGKATSNAVALTVDAKKATATALFSSELALGGGCGAELLCAVLASAS